MARSINKVTLLGNLTSNPVLRTTKSAKSVCDFRIATNRTFTDNQGQRKELAEFHNIVAWGKLADIAGGHLVKGSRVYAEGRLQTREYETADGQKKSRTEIVIDQLVLLDNKTVIDAVSDQENAQDNETDAAAGSDGLSDAAFAEAETN
jgi:single-strand DNA-binding protein